MMNEYKRANDTLHPTHSAVERAVRGEDSKRKGRPLKALVPAGVAAVAAVALLITGIPGTDGETGGGPLLWPSPLPRLGIRWYWRAKAMRPTRRSTACSTIWMSGRK